MDPRLLIGIGSGPRPPSSEEEPEGLDPLVEMAAEEVFAALDKKDPERFVRSLRALMRAMRD